MRKPQSLRAQLLARLTLPLIAVVVLDAAVSYFVALHYADRAYDSWLLDSAKSLAQEVKTQRTKSRSICRRLRSKCSVGTLWTRPFQGGVGGGRIHRRRQGAARPGDGGDGGRCAVVLRRRNPGA